MGSVGSCGSVGSANSCGSLGSDSSCLPQRKSETLELVRSESLLPDSEVITNPSLKSLGDSIAPFADDLKAAAKCGDIEEIRSLLEKGANVNYSYSLGLTPLHFVAMHGHLEAAKLLIEAKAKVTAVTTDSLRLTARAIAESEHHDELVKLFEQNTDGCRGVTLHIYDLGISGSEVINSVLSVVGTGAFHTGVEVYGTEYSFGYTPTDAVPGVVKCVPRQCSGHRFRESLILGETTLEEKEVQELVRQLGLAWPGSSYNLLKRNCTHFCDTFCRWLAVGPVPAWILSLSAAGASVDHGVSAAADAARNTAIIASARAMSFDQRFGISDSILREAEQLDEQLRVSEKWNMSAEYNARKLRELDEHLKISESLSRATSEFRKTQPAIQGLLTHWGHPLQSCGSTA
eukprot:TRINITY_DN21621_c0_g1_i1.p1 TRINITY_DN21621_c0_g1~~TRINITY_DN21621_c0_g1_i1.p1  ORF type:complete len:403 (+),score=50.95 TRINITY_DN21621_c0_g1_i1:92-1300(+)